MRKQTHFIREIAEVFLSRQEEPRPQDKPEVASSFKRLGGGHRRSKRLEADIIRLAAEGLSNREIAQRLYLSPRTVASHLHRSFPKLGVAGRHQIHGLLAVDQVHE